MNKYDDYYERYKLLLIDEAWDIKQECDDYKKKIKSYEEILKKGPDEKIQDQLNYLKEQYEICSKRRNRVLDRIVLLWEEKNGIKRFPRGYY